MLVAKSSCRHHGTGKRPLITPVPVIEQLAARLEPCWTRPWVLRRRHLMSAGGALSPICWANRASMLNWTGRQFPAGARGQSGPGKSQNPNGRPGSPENSPTKPSFAEWMRSRAAKFSAETVTVIVPIFLPRTTRRVSRCLSTIEYVSSEDDKPTQHRKYLEPPKGNNWLYIPPGVKVEQLQDLTIPLAMIEGEKRASVLWRLACHDTEPPQFIPVALAGACQLNDARLALTTITDHYRSRRDSLPVYRSLIAAETGP
jgi:hypothetical protein